MKQFIKYILSLSLSLFPSPKHPTHQHPGLHLRWRYGWVRGQLFKIKATFLRRFFGATRITIGSGFSLQGTLRARGPGQISIGDEVTIDARTDLYTHSTTAQVTIGSFSYLNGTRLGCANNISIEEFAIVSDVRIMDTDFHSISKRRHERGAEVITAPVSIRRNVWVGAGAVVLKGVEIGENSVVGFSSVVTKSLPPNSIGVGNPCRVVGEVPE